eukprot:TRINITY_DN27173_c0_g1_i2.p1 TRINITY_DN27173_c0_g1~~TRINITY_DN27173_c0_g1_i2.p1  ORF type:complete len:172 (+),score=6.57 TRINITY_DN27173_c0_g1_i2:29-544(+)
MTCVPNSTCFFFQAEDGIRDAQESRGLGDVYKRQVLCVYILPVGSDFVSVTFVARKTTTFRMKALLELSSYVMNSVSIRNFHGQAPSVRYVGIPPSQEMPVVCDTAASHPHRATPALSHPGKVWLVLADLRTLTRRASPMLSAEVSMITGFVEYRRLFASIIPPMLFRPLL